MSVDPPTPSAEPVADAAPNAADELDTSEWGLEWGDVSLIRQKLALTPTERLRAAQGFLNTVLRIRARNAG
jgi:hypothetical protein